jgi:hypothetical protein
MDGPKAVSDIAISGCQQQDVEKSVEDVEIRENITVCIKL